MMFARKMKINHQQHEWFQETTVTSCRISVSQSTRKKRKRKEKKKICLITGKFRLHGHMQAIWILRTEEQIKEEKAFFILKRLKILSKMSSNLVFFFPFITTTVFVEKKPWLNMHVSMVKTTSRSKRRYCDSKAAMF